MNPDELSHAPIDPTDVLALVAMALFSMRRIRVKMASAGEFPHVPPPAFEDWKARAFSAYSVGVRASFLKFALNTVWYYGAPWLGLKQVAAGGLIFAVVGALLFIGWVVALLVAWYRISEVRKRATGLGIDLSARTRSEGDSPQS